MFHKDKRSCCSLLLCSSQIIILVAVEFRFKLSMA